MGQEEEKQEDHLPSLPQLPILPRLDRLDRLLQFLEEKHSNSFTKKRMGAEEEEWCNIKPMSSVLEEVHIKGTLLQRLELLEFRVLQLSLEMDADCTSRSSSSSLNIVGHADQNEHRESIFTEDLKEGDNGYAEVNAGTAQQKAIQNGKRRYKNRHKKWLGLFQMGC